MQVIKKHELILTQILPHKVLTCMNKLKSK